MCYESDFIHRQIEIITRSLSVLLVRKDSGIALSSDFFAGDEDKISEERLLEHTLKRMVGLGNINEAETFLFDDLENNPTRSKFLIALEFYQYLNTLGDEFLNENNFTGEEIVDGLDALKKLYERVSAPKE